MKKFFKYTLPAIALCALAACSDDDNVSNAPVDPNYGKELIAFDGDGSGITRASLTRAGFTKQTKVYMRIKAEATGQTTRYAEATATASANITATETGEGVMDHYGLVGDHSDLSYNAGEERFWDDAFGRDSKLTVYAFAIPNETEADLPTWSKTTWKQIDASTNPNWYTAGADDKTVSWTVGTEAGTSSDKTIQQTADTRKAKDLTYSNNISTNGTGGRYTHTYSSSTDKWTTSMGNGQMEWIAKETGSTTGKFDQGHLIFNHALSWIEINLKEGEGFNNAATTDFGWTNPTTQSITLKNFYTTGTFDVSDGTWSGQSSLPISLMDEETATVESGSTGKTNRHLHAFVVPGNNLMTTTSNVIEFEIDNAKYYVTGKQIAEAIQAFAVANSKSYTGFTTTTKGEHYIINLTVAKKGIERITAAIVDWEEVNGNADAKNTYPTFTLEDRGRDRGERLEGTTAGQDDGKGPQFNLYRSGQTASDYITGTETMNWDWQNGYWTTGDVATKQWVANTATGTDPNNSHWKTTNWYWPDNKTYYHFRAAGYTENTSGAPVLTTGTVAASGSTPALDYFTITSGTSYKDYIWGAPFKDIDASAKFTYSTTSGFDLEGRSNTNYQINPGIGAMDDEINMVLFHMTSQIYVDVKTSTDASAVSLKTGSTLTQVEILNFLPDGRVLMGNGLVQTTSTTRTDAGVMTGGTHAAKSGENPEQVTSYMYGIVPQPLAYSGGTIGLRITTPDGNQYYVKDLSQITATSVSTENLTNPYGSSNTIDKWLPNYKYTYKIIITKKGIERITAAVVGWEEVISNDIPINLEN